MFNELDEITQEIIRNYKPALTAIGIDFTREELQEAISDCDCGLESAFQATISYWIWKQQIEEKFQYPNAFLIKAIRDNWQPFTWQDDYLNHPKFKSNGQIWWEEAAKIWGQDLRNSLVADVSDRDGGEEYIVFTSGKQMSLKVAKVWGWQRVLDYAHS
ncbi:MAG: hypothetical protein ACRC2R_02315 [Xenococcaceae cyanobacterium]